MEIDVSQKRFQDEFLLESYILVCASKTGHLVEYYGEHRAEYSIEYSVNTMLNTMLNTKLNTVLNIV